MNDATSTTTTSTAVPVTLYTTAYCGYCTSAKRLLGRLGIAYEEVDLSNNPGLRMRLSDENDGYRTVPMIYLEGEFIGGFDELAALERKGKLAKFRKAS